MKRSGFTMIELVFVIVILGILASVAIPKLAATRDDAQIAKSSTEIASLVSDIGAYYTAQGHFSKLSDMTNVQVSTDGTKDSFTAGSTTDLSVANEAVYYIDAGRSQKCVKITSDDATGKLTLAKEAAATSVFCKGLVIAVEPLLKDHVFGGSSIYK